MLCDAHVHLASNALVNELSQILSTYDEIGLSQAVVVGTCPEDWAKVVEIAAKDERFTPAIGLHPWKVNEAPDDWQEQFLDFLDQGVRVIGEIGLDQWVEGHDIERQQEAFSWQLSLATEHNLPTSIHCLKAHEPLLQVLRSETLPDRGFKLHAYNGPLNTMVPLLDLGAYFSFNAGQLKPNARRVRELIKRVPDDRILIETDAPDFLPQPELREFEYVTSTAAEDSRPPINHPANIRVGYRAIADLRGSSFEKLAQTVEANFKRYFTI